MKQIFSLRLYCFPLYFRVSLSVLTGTKTAKTRAPLLRIKLPSRRTFRFVRWRELRRNILEKCPVFLIRGRSLTAAVAAAGPEAIIAPTIMDNVTELITGEGVVE